MKYDFDRINNRFNTGCAKWDGQKIRNKNFNENTIPLQVADMDFRTAQVIIDKMHEVSERGIYGYTSDKFKHEYRDSIINWFDKYFNLEINPEEIVYSDGSISMIEGIIKACSNPSDGIIIQRPVYGHFTQAIEEDTGRVVVNNQMIHKNGNYYIDYSDLEEKCRNPKNKIMIFCSPQNPVGKIWEKDEIKRVHEICSKYGVILISDEVHCDLLRDNNKHYPIYNCIDDYKNVVMISAISKTFNLAGLKCANAIIKDKKLREKIISEFGNRTPTPFALEALIAAYSEEGREWLDQLNEYIDETFDLIERYIKEYMPKLKYKRPQGTYMAWLDFSEYGLSSEEIHEKIYVNANVILQDGYVHDPDLGGQFQRMCVCSPKSVIKEALIRISEEFK